jgi:YebC/PmpR family DNA-binding regulatory protein
MSGHSKWSTIKHKKALTDAKRANAFTKLGRLISVASKEGSDPNANFKLKLVIEQARKANMPKDNIERAIKRGTGELKDQAVIEEVIYEAFGLNGTMMIIKTLTDNKNRTVSEIKMILGKFGGKLGGVGSVMWNFEISGTEYKPKNIMEANEEIKAQHKKLLEMLEEQEDVQKIYDNI